MIKLGIMGLALVIMAWITGIDSLRVRQWEEIKGLGWKIAALDLKIEELAEQEKAALDAMQKQIKDIQTRLSNHFHLKTLPEHKKKGEKCLF